MAWTTDVLLARVRARAGRPTADPDFTDAVLLAICDDVISERMLPAIHAVRQDYGVTSTDIAIVADQRDYRIPSRAAFGVVREVVLLDANGEIALDLPLASVEEYALYPLTGEPCAHAIEGDRIVLLPTPASATGSLRVHYYRRPSVLVAASTSADEQPHAITSGATTVTVTLGNAHGFDVADVVDVVQAKPPFDVIGQDKTVTQADATTVTYATAVSIAATSDYVCTAGETPVPHLPAELHPVLAIGAAAEVLRRAKDPQAGEREGEFERKLAAGVSAMVPRNHGEPRKIVNHYSALRSGRRVGGWWAR